MYINFFKFRICYDIMFKSFKIVVFDIKFRVSNVFYICFVISSWNNNFIDWYNVLVDCF